MLRGLINALFGCSHWRMTFPLTLSRARGPVVTCLDCGSEFYYDWTAMSIGAKVGADKQLSTPDLSVDWDKLKEVG